jgi:hypothetical protein
LESDSNITLETVKQLAKDPESSCLTLFAIVISLSSPTNVLIEMRPTSMTKSPTTLKLQFPSAIEIPLRVRPSSQHGSNCWSPAGRQIDESDEQPSNTRSSIQESLESDSNVIVARDSHPEKHALHSLSTEDGMQIDESEVHPANAQASIDHGEEPSSNVTLDRE